MARRDFETPAAREMAPESRSVAAGARLSVLFENPLDVGRGPLLEQRQPQQHPRFLRVIVLLGH